MAAIWLLRNGRRYLWWNIQVPYRCQEEIDKNDSQDTAFRDNGNYCYCGYFTANAITTTIFQPISLSLLMYYCYCCYHFHCHCTATASVCPIATAGTTLANISNTTTYYHYIICY